MKRLYEQYIKKHFEENTQMLFLVGPRQVGKTTLAKAYQKQYQESLYLNWDVVNDRAQMLSGQKFIEKHFPIEVLRDQKPLIIFDEIHKYRDWKNYLKGFYDLYGDHYHILVTGSARLDVFQSGGDSLMGRYFQYRIHPLSLYEINHPTREPLEIVSPSMTSDENFNNLYKYGGFPNPYLKSNSSFSTKWHALRSKQLFYEDIQSVSNIHEISQLEVLAELLKHQTGQLLNRSSLAKKIQVTVQTISRWIETLERFYYCYAIKPWSKNISRSLIKEPKIYLWDWSLVDDEGSKVENFVASHLLKAVHFWNDIGVGDFGLYFLRDKDKREVDFLVTKNQKPWFMVEVKTSDKTLSKVLEHFRNETKVDKIFQTIQEMPYVDKNCFELDRPVVVPVKTFLSQLV